MNNFAVEIQFMQLAAANIMRRIAQLEIAGGLNLSRLAAARKAIGPDAAFNPKDARLQVVIVSGESPLPGLSAVCSIVRAHVQAPADPKIDSTLKSEIDAVTQLLNLEVSRVFAESDAVGGPWYLEPFASPLWHVAHGLIAYLRFFANPRLLEFDPIKICPRCNRLFLQRRSKQEFCSNKCRFERWRQDKAGEDPTYWKNKAAASRAARKAQKLARADSRKPSSQPLKSGVDSGVELSPKATKKHGKARKG